jgi:hypothetical protein
MWDAGSTYSTGKNSMIAVFVRTWSVIALWCALQPTIAAAEAPDAKLWGQAQGMSAAVLLAHTTEPILWGMGDMDGGTEHLKPLIGLAGYGTVTTGLFLEKRWGLFASIALPVVFWTPQLLMAGTYAMCWTDRQSSLNGFNIPMVAMETFVAVRSMQLLRRNSGQTESAQRRWNVGTTATSVHLHRRF